jgi:hypothetical protein
MEAFSKRVRPPTVFLRSRMVNMRNWDIEEKEAKEAKARMTLPTTGIRRG